MSRRLMAMLIGAVLLGALTSLGWSRTSSQSPPWRVHRYGAVARLTYRLFGRLTIHKRRYMRSVAGALQQLVMVQQVRRRRLRFHAERRRERGPGPVVL